MKYFVIAGEASGDLHAAHLIEALRKQDPNADFMGLGGDRMEAAGCRLYRDYRKMAFMGWVAVLRHLTTIRENFRLAEEALLNEQPEVLILVDYPGFNLRMAQFVRRHLPAMRIYYYIPPKVWAWKRWRIHRLMRLTDGVYSILPFEPEYYRQRGYTCTYVGNPTLNVVRAWQVANGELVRSTKTIAVLPGSRRSEVSHCLPKMLAAARRVEGMSIVVAAAPGIDDAFYQPYLRSNETLVRDTYRLLATATVAVVNSGTATLEAALLGCPQMAVYHIACPHLAGLIWKAVFVIRHFTLVNILADKRDPKGEPMEVIREWIAYLFTEENIECELRHLLTDEAYKKNMLTEYEHIRSLLGDSDAASTTASFILKRNSETGN